MRSARRSVGVALEWRSSIRLEQHGAIRRHFFTRRTHKSVRHEIRVWTRTNEQKSDICSRRVRPRADPRIGQWALPFRRPDPSSEHSTRVQKRHTMAEAQLSWGQGSRLVGGSHPWGYSPHAIFRDQVRQKETIVVA